MSFLVTKSNGCLKTNYYKKQICWKVEILLNFGKKNEIFVKIEIKDKNVF